ncbi:MAG: 3-hydroxybutyryl-CoA dehydrogenase [Rhodospirillales bacterium]|nr:3-hydroxybutyryl-CoA dehydrogenase [Rhodospirillales bacterium]MDE2574593.1 3-hydroxybutyryl-CoA dehydrogenase [Rhodospirillales bacterium]
MTAPVACLGAGRMGRGIAVAFAYAGRPVRLVDLKPRDADAFHALATQAQDEIRTTLRSLAAIGLFEAAHLDAIAGRVTVVPAGEAGPALRAAEIIFEGVPEIPALKREILAHASRLAGPEPIIASTTSTILVDDISSAVAQPERFLNAHWLNPAYLMPLVELSPGARTDPAVLARLRAVLEGIGKKPITCAASPGYIVPRIQALAMNEAARMVGEGVASAADLDAAIRYGFGLRFAVLGLLEFIDWGGGDILHHASRYLTEALGDARYAAPPIIAENMASGRIGLRTGQGFYDHRGTDIDAYRQERMAAFAALLRSLALLRPPVLGEP